MMNERMGVEREAERGRQFAGSRAVSDALSGGGLINWESKTKEMDRMQKGMAFKNESLLVSVESINFSAGLGGTANERNTIFRVRFVISTFDMRNDSRSGRPQCNARFTRWCN